MRVNATNRQIDQCDYIWIVAPIERAITNTTIDSLLGRYADAFKGKVVVILTRSDADLTEMVVGHLKREHVDMTPYVTLQDEERRLRVLINRRSEQVSNRLQKLFGPKRAANMSANKEKKLREELSQFQEELNHYNEQAPQLASKRFSTLVRSRNAHVARRTQEERRNHMPEGVELQVFAVSNLHYAALTGATAIEGDLMDAETTGIPALREMVRSMVAPTLLQRVEDFIEHRAAIFLEGLALWTSSVAVENPEKIMALVSSPQQRTKPMIDSYVESMLKFAEKSIVKPLEKKQDQFTQHALSVLEKKAEWHSSTFVAFVKKYGNHKTKLQPQQSWNEQFLEMAIKITNIEWDTFLELQTKEFTKLKDDLINLIDGIRDSLKGIRPHSAVLK